MTLLEAICGLVIGISIAFGFDLHRLYVENARPTKMYIHVPLFVPESHWPLAEEFFQHDNSHGCCHICRTSDYESMHLALTSAMLC